MMYAVLQYNFVLCGYHSRCPGLRYNLLSRVPIGATATGLSGRSIPLCDGW